MYFPSFQFVRNILLIVITFSCNISNVIGQTLFPFSIAQYIQSTANLSTLRQIINNPVSIELFTFLDGNHSFTPATGAEPKITLFAPTNEAFVGIDRTNAAFTLDLIKYHTVPDRGLLSKDLMSNLIVNTLLNDSSLINLPIGQGQVLYLTKSVGGNITINDGNTRVIQADIECSNGVIHLIDTVVIPPRSLIDTANSLELTQFISAFMDANLLYNINKTTGITIFVPTNDAFSRSNISSMESAEKNSLLQRHVISSKVIYEIKDGMDVDKLHFMVINDTAYVNNGKIEKSDVLLQNGVMFIVNSLLLPLPTDDVGKHDDNGPQKVTPTEGYEGDNGYKTDKKLIIGSVLGGICGGIVILLFSCMIFKWYRAQKRSSNTTPTPFGK